MIKQFGDRVKRFMHLCAVPFAPPSNFHYQYGSLCTSQPSGDEDYQHTGIVFSQRSQCWSLDCDEYASPIKFCPLCGVDLVEVEGRPA